MTLEIKINLAKPPEKAPWDFPHRCFRLAQQIQAVFDVIKDPQPLGPESDDGTLRELAYRQLRALANEMCNLFPAGKDEQSPFTDAMSAVFGDRASVLLKEHYARRALLTAGEFARQRPDIPKEMAEARIDEVEKQFAVYVEGLNKLGLYMLRMTRTAGHNLPEEFVVQVEPARPGWIPVYDGGE
jgi:hypothetical protein